MKSTIEQSVISTAKKLISEMKNHSRHVQKSATAYHSVRMSYAGVLTLKNLVDGLDSGFSVDTQLEIADIQVNAYFLMTEARQIFAGERKVA